MKATNERNVAGSSITINFHSRWGKKTYLKAQKMFEISQTWFAAWTRVRINYSRKSESVSFSHKFCSYFIGCGFAYRAKSWIQLRTKICTLPFLFSKVQAAALNPLSVFKTLLKAHRSPSFRRGWGKEKIIHKKSFRGLCSPLSSILRPPKHRLMFFLSILSAKEVICPF